MEAIEVNGLVKDYGNVRAVDNVSFSVRRGEVFALMGPNGSGKSTLASVMATVNRPTKGSVKIMGLDVASEVEKVRRLINYIPEFRFSSPNLTGKENLVFYARLLGLPESETEQVSKVVLNKVHLSDSADKMVSAYSSGMRRRLEMASAFIGEASILILDEPTTGLDPSIRREIMGWFIEELQKKEAILFTTHIGEDADAASRVGFMKDGKIVAEGTPEELKKQFAGESTIHLKMGAKGVEAVEALKKFSKDSKLLETEDGYRLYSDDPEKVIPRVFEAMSRAGYKILEIDSVRPTLEDAFFRMTGAPLGG